MAISLRKLSLDEKINMRDRNTNKDLTKYAFHELLRSRFRKEYKVILKFQQNKLDFYYKRSARG